MRNAPKRRYTLRRTGSIRDTPTASMGRLFSRGVPKQDGSTLRSADGNCTGPSRQVRHAFGCARIGLSYLISGAAQMARYLYTLCSKRLVFSRHACVECRVQAPEDQGPEGPLGPEGICGALPDTSTRRLRSSHWRAEYRSVP